MTPAARVAERRAEIAQQEIRVSQARLQCGPNSAPATLQEIALDVFRENLALALEDLAAQQCSVAGCSLDSIRSDVEGHCIVHRHMKAHARGRAA